MQCFYRESCVRAHRGWQGFAQDHVALGKGYGEPRPADLERIQQANFGSLRAIRGIAAESVVRPLVRQRSVLALGQEVVDRAADDSPAMMAQVRL